MKEKTIILDALDIMRIVDRASCVKGDVTVVRGNQYIDAKSLLGMVSLAIGPTNKIRIQYPEDAKDFDEFLNTYEVKE